MLHFKLVKKIKKTIKDSLTMSDTLAEFVNENESESRLLRDDRFFKLVLHVLYD